MQHNNITDERKGNIIKIVFFLALLCSIAFIYFENGTIKDIFYFAIVFIMFIRFLILKLYH